MVLDFALCIYPEEVSSSGWPPSIWWLPRLSDSTLAIALSLQEAISEQMKENWGFPQRHTTPLAFLSTWCPDPCAWRQQHPVSRCLWGAHRIGDYLPYFMAEVWTSAHLSGQPYITSLEEWRSSFCLLVQPRDKQGVPPASCCKVVKWCRSWELMPLSLVESGYRKGWLSFPSSPGVTNFVAFTKQGMAEWGLWRTGDPEWNRKWSLWFNHRAFPWVSSVKRDTALGESHCAEVGVCVWVGGHSSYGLELPQNWAVRSGRRVAFCNTGISREPGPPPISVMKKMLLCRKEHAPGGGISLASCSQEPCLLDQPFGQVTLLLWVSVFSLQWEY